MSETNKNSSGCCGGNSGSCSSAKSDSASVTKSETSSQSVSKPATIQNGKGSAPRNVGPRFKKNFGKIKWGQGKRQRVEGRREVKVYG